MEHLADARELVLPLQAEDHAEETVELGALHALAEDEDVAGELLLVLGIGEIDVAAQRVRGAGDELVLALDRGDLLEHGLALVRIDPEAADHVKEAVGVDVLLVGVAAEDQLQLRRGHQLAHDVDDVVPDDSLGGGEITDAHADDPAFRLAQLRPLPLLDVLLHRDLLGLPMVRLHLAIQLIGPLVFQGSRLKASDLRPLMMRFAA